MSTQEQLKELSSALTFAADFKDYFKQILEFIKKMKVENKEEMTAILTVIKKMTAEMTAKMEQGNTDDMEKKKKEMMAYCMKNMRTLMAEHKSRLTEIDNKMAQIRDGRDGRIPIKGVDYFDGKDIDENAIIEKLRLNPEDIRNKLEKLENNERLDIKAIRGLTERLEEIEERKIGGGGGGLNYGALTIHQINEEVPVNSGDDLSFTINHTPNPTASLKVYRNGQRLHIVDDFTFSGKTITLLTALVAGEVFFCDYQI